MPLFFGSIGMLLIVAGLRNRIIDGNPSLVSLLQSDFSLSQQGNFTVWAAAIVFIGALGYIPKMKTISRMFLVLVVVVIFVKNKQLQNVFTNIAQFFQTHSSSANVQQSSQNQVTVFQNPNSPIGVSN